MQRKALVQLVSRLAQQQAVDANHLRERLEIPLLEVRSEQHSLVPHTSFFFFHLSPYIRVGYFSSQHG